MSAAAARRELRRASSFAGTSEQEARALTELDKLTVPRRTSRSHCCSTFMTDQKKVVQALLDTLVEGSFDFGHKLHYSVAGARQCPSFRLLPRLEAPMQPSVVDTFAAMVERHFRNACRHAGTCDSSSTSSPFCRTRPFWKSGAGWGRAARRKIRRAGF